MIIDKANSIRHNKEQDPIQVDEEPQAKRPPMLYITDIERYTELLNLLLQNNLQPKYTKQHRKGICLQMNTIKDFCKLRQITDIHHMEMRKP